MQLTPPPAAAPGAVYDEDLRVAFEAVCGADFSGADLPTMTAEALRQIEELEAEIEAGDGEGAALQVNMLRELLAMAGQPAAAGVTLH